MELRVIDHDWAVTRERVEELLRRIIATADPLQIIVFGSRARGDHRADSDLDLAVILDLPQEEVRQRLPYTVVDGIRMGVDLVVVSKTKYDLHRPWINSVFNYIDTEESSFMTEIIRNRHVQVLCMLAEKDESALEYPLPDRGLHQTKADPCGMTNKREFSPQL